MNTLILYGVTFSRSEQNYLESHDEDNILYDDCLSLSTIYLDNKLYMGIKVDETQGSQVNSYDLESLCKYLEKLPLCWFDALEKLPEFIKNTVISMTPQVYIINLPE